MSSFVFIVFLTGFSLASGYRVSPSCECGLSAPVENRIVGGKEATPHQYPWLVAVFNKNALHCGGSLINDLYVLTAGHCVRWVKHKNLYVVLGLHRRHASEGIGMRVSKVILHENFLTHKMYDENDIALLKLPHRVSYDYTRSPVCLPKPGAEYYNKYAIVAGWGKLGERKNVAKILQHTIVKILTPAACANTSMKPYLMDNVLCAYYHRTDACQGDSGGPLVFETGSGKTEQIGIVSWGIGCATPHTPGIYTKVTSFLKWIYDNTKDAVYCSYDIPSDYDYYE